MQIALDSWASAESVYMGQGQMVQTAERRLQFTAFPGEYRQDMHEYTQL